MWTGFMFKPHDLFDRTPFIHKTTVSGALEILPPSLRI